MRLPCRGLCWGGATGVAAPAAASTVGAPWTDAAAARRLPVCGGRGPRTRTVSGGSVRGEGGGRCACGRRCCVDGLATGRPWFPPVRRSSPWLWRGHRAARVTRWSLILTWALVVFCLCSDDAVDGRAGCRFWMVRSTRRARASPATARERRAKTRLRPSPRWAHPIWCIP